MYVSNIRPDYQVTTFRSEQSKRTDNKTSEYCTCNPGDSARSVFRNLTLPDQNYKKGVGTKETKKKKTEKESNEKTFRLSKGTKFFCFFHFEQKGPWVNEGMTVGPNLSKNVYEGHYKIHIRSFMFKILSKTDIALTIVWCA